MMNFFLFVVLSGWTGQVPKNHCSKKIISSWVTTQERTEDFIYYLNLVLKRRIIQLHDLEPFLKSIQNGILINPVPNVQLNKAYVIHYDEFSQLIASGSIDLKVIQEWTQSFVQEEAQKGNQKAKSEQSSKKLPDFIVPDGAGFYKIKHPALGDAYRILKPGGKVDVESDWEKKIWAIHVLKDSAGKLKTLKYSNNEAKKACQELGSHSDLPSAEDYSALFSHFDHTSGFHYNNLTKIGLEDYRKKFLSPIDSRTWTDTQDPKNENNAWVLRGYASSFESFLEVSQSHYYLVRCIAD